MRYASITTCDICNGTGIGVVLWCQGCNLQCPGCHNSELQSFSGGQEFTTETYSKLVKELQKPEVSRLTFSGGHRLAMKSVEVTFKICKYIKRTLPEIKIWIYTGYAYEDIKDLEVLKYIDVLVDGPYIQEQRDITLAFRGSTNQRIIDVPASLKANKVCLYEIY